MAGKSAAQTEAINRSIQVLAEQSASRSDHFLTLRQLADKASIPIPEDQIPVPLKAKPFKERAIIAKAGVLDSPVSLKEDADQLAKSDQLLAFAVTEARKALSQPMTVPELVKHSKLDAKLKAGFKAATEERIKLRTLPMEVAPWVIIPRSAADVAQQLIAQLHRLRDPEHQLYGVDTANLIASANLGNDPLAGKALTHSQFKNNVVFAAAKGSEGLVALVEDAVEFAHSPQLLRWALAQAQGQAPHKPAELVKRAGLNGKLKDRFIESIQEAVLARRLPDDLARQIDVKQSVAEVAENLIQTLEQMREQGSSEYPVHLDRLFERVGLSPNDKLAQDVRSNATFKKRFLIFGGEQRTALAEDLDAPPYATRLLAAALAAARTQGRNTRTAAFSAKEIAAALDEQSKHHRKRIETRITEAAQAAQLPPGLHWISVKGAPLFFHGADMQPPEAQSVPIPAVTKPAQPPPTTSTSTRLEEFPARFAQAFEQIDQRMGRRNFVKVYELRRELPQYNREQFDQGLWKLREQGRYAMNSSDGNVVALSPEERDAGIMEAGSLLVYVSRK